MRPTEAEIEAAFAEPDAPPPVSLDRPPPGLPRPLEVALTLAGLVLTAPPLAFAALLIRLQGGGSITYRQPRVGQGERTFELIKLRTMRAGSDPIGAGTAVGEDDPRLTRVGAVLRRLSIDELPNLINVLRGDMALVGPRPTIPAHLPYMSARQRQRHLVRPGITGWAQVNGRLGIEWGERIELDLQYLQRRSSRLDLEILARTLAAALRGEGLG